MVSSVPIIQPNVQAQFDQLGKNVTNLVNSIGVLSKVVDEKAIQQQQINSYQAQYDVIERNFNNNPVTASKNLYTTLKNNIENRIKNEQSLEVKQAYVQVLNNTSRRFSALLEPIRANNLLQGYRRLGAVYKDLVTIGDKGFEGLPSKADIKTQAENLVDENGGENESGTTYRRAQEHIVFQILSQLDIDPNSIYFSKALIEYGYPIGAADAAGRIKNLITTRNDTSRARDFVGAPTPILSDDTSAQNIKMALQNGVPNVAGSAEIFDNPKTSIEKLQEYGGNINFLETITTESSLQVLAKVGASIGASEQDLYDLLNPKDDGKTTSEVNRKIRSYNSAFNAFNNKQESKDMNPKTRDTVQKIYSAFRAFGFSDSDAQKRIAQITTERYDIDGLKRINLKNIDAFGDDIDFTQQHQRLQQIAYKKDPRLVTKPLSFYRESLGEIGISWHDGNEWVQSDTILINDDMPTIVSDINDEKSPQQRTEVLKTFIEAKERGDRFFITNDDRSIVVPERFREHSLFFNGAYFAGSGPGVDVSYQFQGKDREKLTNLINAGETLLILGSPNEVEIGGDFQALLHTRLQTRKNESSLLKLLPLAKSYTGPIVLTIVEKKILDKILIDESETGSYEFPLPSSDFTQNNVTIHNMGRVGLRQSSTAEDIVYLSSLSVTDTRQVFNNAFTVSDKGQSIEMFRTILADNDIVFIGKDTSITPSSLNVARHNNTYDDLEKSRVGIDLIAGYFNY